MNVRLILTSYPGVRKNLLKIQNIYFTDLTHSSTYQVGQGLDDDGLVSFFAHLANIWAKWEAQKKQDYLHSKKKALNEATPEAGRRIVEEVVSRYLGQAWEFETLLRKRVEWLGVQARNEAKVKDFKQQCEGHAIRVREIVRRNKEKMLAMADELNHAVEVVEVTFWGAPVMGDDGRLTAKEEKALVLDDGIGFDFHPEMTWMVIDTSAPDGLVETRFGFVVKVEGPFELYTDVDPRLHVVEEVPGHEYMTVCVPFDRQVETRKRMGELDLEYLPGEPKAPELEGDMVVDWESIREHVIVDAWREAGRG